MCVCVCERERENCMRVFVCVFVCLSVCLFVYLSVCVVGIRTATWVTLFFNWCCIAALFFACTANSTAIEFLWSSMYLVLGSLGAWQFWCVPLFLSLSLSLSLFHSFFLSFFLSFPHSFRCIAFTHTRPSTSPGTATAITFFVIRGLGRGCGSLRGLAPTRASAL